MSPTGKPPALGIGSEIAHRSRKFTLALSPIRDTHSEGFSYFVTSIAAPAASGWSVRRVGLAPTGKRRLVTAHTPSGRPCLYSLFLSGTINILCRVAQVKNFRLDK